MPVTLRLGTVANRSLEAITNPSIVGASTLSTAKSTVLSCMPVIMADMPEINRHSWDRIVLNMAVSRDFGEVNHARNTVTLWPINIEMDEDGLFWKAARIRSLRAKIAYTLAHEMRHVWQAATGQYGVRLAADGETVLSLWNDTLYTNADAATLGPEYHNLPWEKDADDYARAFVKKIRAS